MNPSDTLIQLCAAYRSSVLYGAWEPVTARWSDLPEVVIEASMASPARTLQRLQVVAGEVSSLERWHFDLGRGAVGHLVWQHAARMCKLIRAQRRRFNKKAPEADPQLLDEARYDAVVRILADENPFALLHAAAAADESLVHRIANEGYNAYRSREKSLQHTVALEFAPPTEHDFDAVARAELPRAVGEFIAALSPDDRVILEFAVLGTSHYESVEQVAERLRISRATAYRRRAELLKTLKTLAQRTDLDDPSPEGQS